MDPIAEQLIARLQSDPDDHETYAALQQRYRDAGDFASLANLLEGWAGHNTQNWEAASEAFAAAGDAIIDSGADRDRAKQLYRQSLQLNVLHPRAGAALQQVLMDDAEYQQLAEFLDSYAQTLEGCGAAPEYVGGLYLRLSTLWAREFERPDVAADYAQRAAALGVTSEKPNEQQSLDEAERSADELLREANNAENSEHKVALLSQLAEVQARSLNDVPSAIQTLRHAISIVPGDIEVMHQLASLLLIRAETADPQTARSDRRRVAELLYQIAQGVSEVEAIPYLESALDAMPAHEGALALLERLAPTQGLSESLPRYWVAYIASAGEGPDLDARRLLLANAYLKAGQPDDAIYCLEPVAERGSARAHELMQHAYALQSGVQSGPAPKAEEDLRDANRLPAHRPPARRGDDERIRDGAKITALRKLVQEALTGRRPDDAAEHCRKILELDPSDPEAFGLLEGHHRKRRDYTGLRDLLLASTRMPGLPVDARKLRLREVATLSESKLRDNESAVSAWRSVVTLDPSDREATSNLKRLLKKAQQWDELASVLQRETLSTTALEDKAAMLQEIALIHRDKRQDKGDTADALEQLYALKPHDNVVRDELCDLFVELERLSDAVPLLRERLNTSRDEHEQLRLSNRLAEILHEQLHDTESAFAVCEQMLERKASDKNAFDRMQRIDTEGGNHQRLLKTLERRAHFAPKADRSGLFVQMATIAEEQMHDLDKAADYLGDALDLAPDNEEALRRLVEAFERAGRYSALVEVLRERAVLERETKNRAPLHRRIGQILAEHLGDENGAAEAYRRLLELEEDEEALRFLRRMAIQSDDANELADILRRLANCVSDKTERRDLLSDLATVLHERLSRAPDAIKVLLPIVQELDPGFEPAIEQLELISELVHDDNALAVALERKLALGVDARTRLPIARRLADLCEQKLHSDERAMAALQQWTVDDAHDPVPLRRLRKHLLSGGHFNRLLATLDALAECEHDFDARDEASISAARVAFEKLADPEGAWRRLLPLVAERHEEASTVLREVADSAGMHAELAAQYVKFAQETEDPASQGSLWRTAAEIFERDVNDLNQAFEASLRMLATDINNRELLVMVDRLSVKTQNFRRLAQVYDRLLKIAESDADKVLLLVRNADLLERDQPEDALDRVLRACALAPADESLLQRAEVLAERTRRSEELLVVYDRRRTRYEESADKVRLLLRAARLCDGALRDRERANAYLKTAIATADTPQLAVEVESAARELDAARPELGQDGVRRALVRSQAEIAERAEPAAATALMLRGAEFLRVELDDDRGAFDLLRQGVTRQPKSDEVYAAFLGMAEKLKRLNAVDAHLSRLTDEATDSASAVELLKRRAALLEGQLKRFEDAAAVYTKLAQLRPDDLEIADKLRAGLRRSGRYQELLLALNKQLQRTRDPAARVPLLKAVARCWEVDLKNRWEALDAWKAVLREEDDDEAAAGVRRLERSRTTSTDEVFEADAPVSESAVGTSDAPSVSDSMELSTQADDGSASAAALDSVPLEPALTEQATDTLDASAETESESKPDAAVVSLAQDASPKIPTAAQDIDDTTPDTGAQPEAAHAAALDFATAPTEQSATEWETVTDLASEVETDTDRATPKAQIHEEPPVDEGESGLDALDARLSALGMSEEVDVLDGVGGIAVEVDDELDAVRLLPARVLPPPPRRGLSTGSIPSLIPSSRPPPPRASQPPPMPHGRTSSVPIAPLPRISFTPSGPRPTAPASRPSQPPPLPHPPRRAASTSDVPPVQSAAPRAPSMPPPLPGRPGSNDQPNPARSAGPRSQPPLPTPRKS